MSGKGQSQGDKGKAPAKKRVCRDTPPASPSDPSFSDASSSSSSTDQEDSFTKFWPATKREPLYLSKPQEEDLVRWLRYNPILWKISLSEYLRRSTKEAIWENKAAEMKVDVFDLLKWYQGRRLLFRKLVNIGPGLLSTRNKWILANYSFLREKGDPRARTPTPEPEPERKRHKIVCKRRASDSESEEF